MTFPITFQSANGNCYFLNAKTRQVQPCHPLLYHLIQLHLQSTPPQEWVDNLKDDPTDIPGLGPFPLSTIHFYLTKFHYFLKQGAFTGNDMSYRVSGKITAASVTDTLANIRQITFETTDGCNLDCLYCGFGKLYNDYDARENKNLNPEVAHQVLNYFANHLNSNLNSSEGKTLYISFYGGEPLLNFPFIHSVVHHTNHMHWLHNKITFSITTNGVLLDKYMDFLAKNEFNLLISLDGNATNNGYRIFKNHQPAFPTITRNIDGLKSRYPDYFEKSVNFNAVLHNKNSVESIYKFFKEKYGKTPSIAEINTNGIREDKRDEFLATYANINHSLTQSHDCQKIEEDMFIALPRIQETAMFLYQYGGYTFKNYWDLLFNDQPAPRLPTGTCFPFSKKVFITVNGKILACERIGHQFVLGHAGPDSVDINPGEIAGIYNEYFDKIRNQCAHCADVESCSQCIFNLDIEKKNPVCYSFKNREEFAQQLSGQLSYLEEHGQTYGRIMKSVILE